MKAKLKRKFVNHDIDVQFAKGHPLPQVNNKLVALTNIRHATLWYRINFSVNTRGVTKTEIEILQLMFHYHVIYLENGEAKCEKRIFDTKDYKMIHSQDPSPNTFQESPFYKDKRLPSNQLVVHTNNLVSISHLNDIKLIPKKLYLYFGNHNRLEVYCER